LNKQPFFRSVHRGRGWKVYKYPSTKTNVKKLLLRKEIIYIGPSIEGHDEEYVEVINGKVSDLSPSYIKSHKQRTD